MDPAETAWRDHAACKPKTHDPEEIRQLHALFFGDHEAAKKICAGCRSAPMCLHWAMDFDYRAIIAGREIDTLHGVWGGYTTQERRTMIESWR